MSDSPNRRVVITGVGLISPVGNSKEKLWDALTTRRSGIAPLESLPTDHFPMKSGGEAREFTGNIDDFGPLDKQTKRTIRKGQKVMCRDIEMGVAAAQLALQDAGLGPEVYDPSRTGVVYGSDYILTMPNEFAKGVKLCLDENGEFDFSHWGDKGKPEVTPLWLLKYLPNMPASHVAIYNDLRGPSNSITMREASSNLAVGEAYCTIARGNADTMLAGATGTRIHPLRTVHVALQGEIAKNGSDPGKLCRPFDLNRTGMVIGEGAGVVVLEELASAEKRGATILGEVIGHASSIAMDRNGEVHTQRAISNVLKQSLRSAGLNPDEIGHLHAHGLSTRKSDADEAQGIHDVFGSRKKQLPVVAAKSYFGNLGAGSGMVELVGSLMALNHETLFPILNYENADPDCPIFAVTTGDVPAGANFVNINITPVGQASAVVIKRL